MSERRPIRLGEKEILALMKRYGWCHELYHEDRDLYDELFEKHIGEVTILERIIERCIERRETNTQMLRNIIEARIAMESAENDSNPQTYQSQE